jgi:CBS domain-containing protein
MATVADVLAKKGSRVYSVAPTATVLAATQLMNRHKIGALVVTLDHGAPSSARAIGMFTERDVLSRVVAEQRDPSTTLVEDVMSTNVAYCESHADLDQIAAVMRERRIRHLPVCSPEGQLQGMISIGDVNAFAAEGHAVAIHYLNEYIHGRV